MPKPNETNVEFLKRKKTKKYELYFPDYKLYTNKNTLLGTF